MHISWTGLTKYSLQLIYDLNNVYNTSLFPHSNTQELYLCADRVLKWCIFAGQPGSYHHPSKNPIGSFLLAFITAENDLCELQKLLIFTCFIQHDNLQKMKTTFMNSEA